ncbi:MAG: hypothetical protein KAR40_14000 [Candidatus Sabulitectum sp.]|nr:hypothetical protein [Candidatus Sabulitectum sp.]
MEISINEFEDGTAIIVVDSVGSFLVPLVIHGEYEPGEPAEGPYPERLASFDMKLVYVHAAEGDEKNDVPDLMLPVSMSDIDRDTVSEIETALAAYITDSINEGALL